jgi:hypothetical protein
MSYDRGKPNRNGVFDIHWRNETMPVFPDGMPLWARVLCLLGYHNAEPRQCDDHHCYGDGTPSNNMKLRDQCGRCGTLL